MKQCTKCQTNFEITQNQRYTLDQLQLPNPTHCPDCRNIRRMMWRNDRKFYRAKSAKSGKPMISMYPENSPYTVYLQDEWFSDEWNPMDYGRKFDFNRPFFEQFDELQKVVPRMNLDIWNCENSAYCNYCADAKNCYLDIAGESNEDCHYNLFVKYSKDVVDSTFVYKSNHCYESINCHNCFNLYYGQYCQNTSDSAFVYDLIGSKNCLFSYNLRNKEYYIFNQPHTKEEYEKKKKEILNGSHQTLKQALDIWYKHLKGKGIFRDYYQSNCENVSGNNLKNCKNVQFGFNVTNAEDSDFLYDVLDAKNCSDLNYVLYEPEFSYELISNLNLSHSAFDMATHYCHEVFYCYQCNHSKNLLGCIGLKHKQYCILNKQYNKEEYETLVPKIIEHMKKTPSAGSGSSTGEWGEFFDAKHSPFAYNETVAHEYFPLTKEEALKQGYRWVDDEKNDQATQDLNIQLPDRLSDTANNITDEVLICEISGLPYKIIPQELTFYRTMNLPLPRRAPLQRHLDRMNLRTPRKLWDRKCDQCQKEIQTTFSPERSERVYCEGCYLKEIY